MKSVICLRIILFQIHFDKKDHSVGYCQRATGFYADEMIQSMLNKKIKHCPAENYGI
jgi:hypothetical protein